VAIDGGMSDNPARDYLPVGLSVPRGKQNVCAAHDSNTKPENTANLETIKETHLPENQARRLSIVMGTGATITVWL